MSIHINIVCDRGAHPGGAIGVGFDSLTETDGDSREARCLCPEHAPR